MKQKLLLPLFLLSAMATSTYAKDPSPIMRKRAQVVCAQDKSSFDNAIMKLNGTLTNERGIPVRAYTEVHSDNYQPINSRTINLKNVETASSPVLYQTENREFKACVTVTESYKSF